jgi:hypothetical protein
MMPDRTKQRARFPERVALGLDVPDAERLA